MRREALESYRDDGVLARALGDVIGRALPIPPMLLLLAGVAGLAALAALEGDAASDPAIVAAVAWFVLLGGLSSGRPHTDRFAWTAPGLLRVGEYGGLVLIAANAGDSTLPAAFALIAALAFRHYDLVYRPRFQGVETPDWLRVVAGGWEGRLVLAVLLLFAGALPAGMFIVAGALGGTFVADCAMSWARVSTSPVAIYEDEEDEGD